MYNYYIHFTDNQKLKQEKGGISRKRKSSRKKV